MKYTQKSADLWGKLGSAVARVARCDDGARARDPGQSRRQWPGVLVLVLVIQLKNMATTSVPDSNEKNQPQK